jgi:hypothetical protein
MLKIFLGFEWDFMDSDSFIRSVKTLLLNRGPERVILSVYSVTHRRTLHDQMKN